MFNRIISIRSASCAEGAMICWIKVRNMYADDLSLSQNYQVISNHYVDWLIVGRNP